MTHAASEYHDRRGEASWIRVTSVARGVINSDEKFTLEAVSREAGVAKSTIHRQLRSRGLPGNTSVGKAALWLQFLSLAEDSEETRLLIEVIRDHALRLVEAMQGGGSDAMNGLGANQAARALLNTAAGLD